MSLDGTQSALLLLLILVAISGIFLIRQNARRRDAVRTRRYTPYVEGLHLLLDGHQDEASKAFREAAENGPYSLEARLRLGIMLRNRGAILQATKIHKAMFAIPGLTTEFQRDVVVALCEDYLSSDTPEMAVSLVEEELSRSSNDPVLLRLLISALEKSEQWERALEMVAKLERLTGSKENRKSALFHVLAAEQANSAGNSRKAKGELNKALTADASCAAARMLLGEIALNEGSVDKAVSEWSEMAMQSPALAPEAYQRIEKALYDAGSYGKIADVYQRVLDARPGDSPALLRMARYAERKGDLDRALEDAQRAAESEPESLQARIAAVIYLSDLERCSEAGAQTREILRLLKDQRRSFVCTHCGKKDEQFRWRCSSCGAVDEFKPQA